MPKDFEIFNVPAEGDCFFEAISAGLKPIKGNKYNAKALREICSNEIRSEMRKNEKNIRKFFKSYRDMTEHVTGVKFMAEEIRIDNPEVMELNVDKVQWGMTEIDGCSLCRNLKVRINLIKSTNLI